MVYFVCLHFEDLNMCCGKVSITQRQKDHTLFKIWCSWLINHPLKYLIGSRKFLRFQKRLPQEFSKLYFGLSTGQSGSRLVDFLQTFNDWKNPKNHRTSLFFFLLCSWTWQDFFQKNPRTFQTIQTLAYCLDVWSGFSLWPTVMNTAEALPKLVSGTIIDTYRGVPLQHSEMQKLYIIIIQRVFF